MFSPETARDKSYRNFDWQGTRLKDEVCGPFLLAFFDTQFMQQNFVFLKNNVVFFDLWSPDSAITVSTFTGSCPKTTKKLSKDG